MRRLRRVVSFSNAAIGIALLALLPSLRAEGNQWDPEGAARAYEEAGRMRDILSRTAPPVLSQYLECAKTYRKVHLRDPHYSRTGDAIYEEGLIYQEMGDKVANSDFYRTAIRRFQLLIRDYGGNRNCPDALLRMGDIYLESLKDEVAAQNTYRFLRANYKNTSASRKLAARGSVAAPSSPKPVVPSPALKPAVAEISATAQASPTGTALVQGIRHWSANEYTRVIIDLDSTAIYSPKRLSNPDRIYFDISGAKLSSQLGPKTLAVDDVLLKQIRVSQNNSETVRVVLDLPTKSDHAVSEMRDPFRIVIDLRKPGSTRGALPASPGETKTLPDLVRSKKSADSNETVANAGKAFPKPKPAYQTMAMPTEPGLRQPPRAITDIGSSLKAGSAPARPVSPTTVASKTLPSEAAATDKRPKDTAPAPVSKPPAASPIKSESEISRPLSAENNAAPVHNGMAAPLAPVEPQAKAEAKTAAAEPKTPSAANSRPAALTTLGNRTLTRMLGLKIGRIVIDPGHGGHDLGTVGPGGLLEKDLVLSIALDLQKLLEDKLGAQVILTRTDDTFISLEERSDIANRFRADLFLSIHANSSPSRSTSGVETYFLNFARTNAEREIASRENAGSSSNISELEDLIKKIAQADKSSESRELASIIQKNLFSGIKRVFPTAQNRGVRSAPFIVLIGANMPSVLTEVAFISNPRDERLLKKSSNQDRLVKALFSGIEGYMKTLGSDVAQNQRRMD